jgi:uncharacterized repeat protein (TIGR04138 family)
VDARILEAVKDDPRYAYEAYEFVCDAVTFTQDRLGRTPAAHERDGANHHVAGAELLRGCCDLAVRDFGMMAPVVFRQWGVAETDDIGNIVFNLIRLERLSRSDRDDPGPLVPPFTLTGVVAKSGKPSVIRVAAPAGKALNLSLDAAAVGSTLTPEVIVTGAKGAVLARAEPSRPNATVTTTVTPPSAEPFAVEVRDLFGTAGPRYVYRLRVVPVVPDLAATVAADRFTLTVGTPLDVPVTLVKSNGWQGPVVPYVEGLPPGVTAEPVPAKDEKTVTLRLRASSVGPPGVIRMGVVSPGVKVLRREARPAVAELPDAPPALWLTIVAPAASKP